LPYTLTFAEVGSADLPQVGGKGANLGELTQASFQVPSGFCVTTRAFSAFVDGAVDAVATLDALTDPEDIEAIRAVGEQLRDALARRSMPDDVRDAVVRAWQAAGPDRSYAVRSSATAEDLPDASFAGQQDTFLNISGQADILESVRRCWISLYTDRAIQYRMKKGFDHRSVRLAVVVQHMVDAEVAGVLFTADPISGNRQVVSIDACFGLGEDLVSGLVTPDHYTYDRRGEVVLRRRVADGSTGTLSDEAIGELAHIGAAIEAHYCSPQDIEWCLQDGEFFVVQSRPITTLFPLPEPRPADALLHAYFSIGHLEGDTEPIPVLGQDLIRTMFPPRSEGLLVAGGRLFCDAATLEHLGAIDPALAGDLQTARERWDALQPPKKLQWRLLPLWLRAMQFLLFVEPTGQVSRRATTCESNMQVWAARLENTAAGPELISAIREMMADIYPMARALWIPMALAANLSIRWLRWLHPDGRDDIDALLEATPNHVGTERDLEITDLAESIRHNPSLIRRLRANKAGNLDEVLDSVKGGKSFARGFDDWMRSFDSGSTASEMDVSCARYSDEPEAIIDAILDALEEEPGAARARHRQLAGAAIKAQERLLSSATGVKSRLTARLCQVARLLIASGAHPRFYGVRCLALARQHLLREGARLVSAGTLEVAEQIWFATLAEVEANDIDADRIRQRAADHARFGGMVAPRIVTSDGESVL